MWDPDTYLRYADERGRPQADLIRRIGATDPGTVVDLGCGPGNLTVELARRWPDARITGLDSSPEMIDAARDLGTAVDFRVADVRDWKPTGDVVVSNATLQWVPDHLALLPAWAGALPPGAWLAFQVPANFDAPSHRAIRELAAEPAWRDRITLRDPAAVHPLRTYADTLLSAGCAVDAWQTSYLHVLPVDGDRHPVLEWVTGTALRPVRAALGEKDFERFRNELEPRLTEAYPVTHGRVLFDFLRLFVVARTSR